jgi:hypothetical protein
LRALILLLTLLAFTLSGCVAIIEESGRQLDEVGDVELTTVLCASELGQGTCPRGNSGELSSDGMYQLLLGHRIPLGVAPPESMTDADGLIAFARNPSFTAELDRLAPIAPAAGQRWVGYVSAPFQYAVGQSQSTATVVARMALLRVGDGSPFSGPFRYRSLIGYRHSDPDPARAVACGDSLAGGNPADQTHCMDFPTDEELKTDLSVPTRDLGILAGPAGTAPRGGTGTIPFTLAYAGATAAPSFSLGAGTSIPGGTAAPGSPTIAPAEAGTTVVGVNVSVPATTPPGPYEVTLSATLGNGQTRSATGLVTVTGAGTTDRNPPEVAMRMRTTPKLRRARKAGVVADISCSESCVLVAEMRAGRISARALGLRIPAGARSVVVGRTTERASASGRRNVRIRFFKGLGTRLLRLRRVSLALSVRALDQAGNVRRRSIQFALVR